MTREELRAARKKAGLTQLQMAEKCGMPKRTYEDIESGRSPMRPVHAGLFEYVVQKLQPGATTKLAFEQDWDAKALDVEDRGAAKIYSMESYHEQGELADGCMFVRLQSYDERKLHRTFKQFEGKRIRVTVEVVE
ncbi:helix-turn-helix transcriptional regulator (plasmid) [Rhizobium bangladeshense]|uniref:helix-turn-helix domain-containing protein n=1 Tax=Rhizobium bangladeshense TaxID=1138189 RepID=UPI001A99B47B|nr:helix-turn-helix transcriptional regulator [Rhizobium bangladeshense]QSY98571.1 helix-turn-helix transcriptional regulator [Rhizobium bangladeshense]